ncbi:MAG: Flp family type IVb pilin [Acidimicrobiia bacterium]
MSEFRVVRPISKRLQCAEFLSMAAFRHKKCAGERGASMVEYALLLVTIAVVVILSLTALGDGLSSNFSETTSLVGS